MHAVQETYVSIGEMKKRLSELTNRVAYGGERLILTSRGRPKAVVVSLEDYRQLKQFQQSRQDRLKALESIQSHREDMLAQRQGQPIDVDVVAMIHEMREERTNEIIESLSDGD